MIDYLTVHDLVWINNVVTGKVNRFDYVTLEEAMAAQYQYGNSTEVLVQAANLLNSLLKKPPFTDGNRRTAFIAMNTFLNANGFATVIDDSSAANLIQSVASGATTPISAVNQLADRAIVPLKASIALRTLITHECNLHADALKILATGD